MNGNEVPQVPQFGKTPAERAARAVLPSSGLVWTAAEIMHWTGMPGTLDTSLATAAAAVIAWGAAGRWAGIPRRLPWWIAVGGAWLTVAVAEGPLHGWPYAPLTWTWAVASLVAWRMARRHPAVVEAQQWRYQRADWLLGKSHRWGLRGSHLLEFEETRLGERYVVSTKGTGKRASAIESGHTAELIAEDEDLPVSRVRVRRHRLAGRAEISIRRTDPWAKPILHPLLDDNPEVDLPGAYSIRDAAPVGQDPETGRVLLVTLWDEIGAKKIVIVAQQGSGKTVVLDDLSERITAASDAIQVRVNLSVKGHAEAERWGPACHLTAFGPHQKSRAVRVLRVVNGIIEWRAQRYKTGQWTPSPGDPLVEVILDEADSAMAVPQVRREVDDIATKGREYGVGLIRAGQRGTTDYGSAKTRAQDDVFVIGKVNRQGEVYHAAGSMGFSLPDMAAYGEGHSGVWAVAELGGGHHSGRAWLFTPADAARIAAERAFSQPELHPACREFLGEPYEELLSTDVFAEWARDHATTPPKAAAQPQDSTPVSPATSPAPIVTLNASDIEHLDFPMDMDDDTRAKLAAIDEKLGNARRIVAETAAMPKPPEVSREALDALTAERWRQVGEQAQIPEEALPVLLRLLREGTTISSVAEALGVSKWDARTFLEKLRNEGIARVDGKGRGARFRLVDDGDGS